MGKEWYLLHMFKHVHIHLYGYLRICVGILIFKGMNPEGEMNTGDK